MKKILHIIMFLNLVTACSLDLPVEDEITGLNAIDNVDIADETLSSIYMAYPKNKIVFSKLSDDFYPNHNISNDLYDFDLYNWNPQELISLSDNLWQRYYSTVSKANLLLGRLDSIKPSDREQIQKLNFIMAQALCLKALSYFDLLQLYAPTYSSETKQNDGIILKNNIVSEQLPRANLEDSYRETEKLLLKAIPLFSEGKQTTLRFSGKSAKALLAKVYFNWAKYEKASNLCDQLTAGLALTKDSYKKVWNSPDGNIENLLAFENENFNYSSIFNKIVQADQYYINPNITYQKSDYRKEVNMLQSDFIMLDNSVIKANFLTKARVDSEGEKADLKSEKPKPIIALRTAELYFIKAESLYKLSEQTKAKQTINAFLSFRNASPITSTGSNFLKDLLSEKKKEFVGEGLSYFDIKRNKIELSRVNYRNNLTVDKILDQDYRWLFPIPLYEVKYNKNVRQNPNWNIFFNL